jgi:hypothetical protein
VRGIFINKINGGGLSLLNELVVDTSGVEIVEVLKLLADKSNYPIGIYCTAGFNQISFFFSAYTYLYLLVDRERSNRLDHYVDFECVRGY